MTTEVTLLHLMGTKETYNKLRPYLKEHVQSPLFWKILQALDDYYKAGVTTVDWDAFKMFAGYVSTKLPKGSYELFDSLITSAKGLSSSSPVVIDDVIRKLIETSYVTKIHETATSILIGSPSTASVSDLRAALDAMDKDLGRSFSTEDLFVAPKLSSVTATAITAGYSWRLPELRKSIGYLRKGDLVFIQARPESGKTTLLSSEVTYIATQLDPDECVVWVNNEEEENKVMLRIMQAHFGVDLETILKNIAFYEALYHKDIGPRIKLLRDDSGMMDVHSLDKLFDELKPSVIVFDTLDKVGGYERTADEHNRIGQVCRWARKRAKRGAAVIATSQADAAAESTAFIGMSSMRGSKTDKPSEADVIISIGREDTSSNKRFLFVPKNKTYGGGEFEEKYRHGKFEIEIVPEIARYKGVF